MAEQAKKKKALGKGLEALFGEINSEVSINKGEMKESGHSDGVLYVSIDDIKPNAMQPRKVFDEDSIAGLADSIQQYGVIQPVMLQRREHGYELIAGERRWRAARKAGLKEVPAIVRELSAEENALFAIIENMQREDLNPVEEASAFKSIIDTFGFTQDEVAKSVGKSRPYVANTLRILKLPESIQGHLSGGTLTAGHANALGAVKDTEKMQVLAEQIVREGMSVRQAELIATRISGGEGAEAKRREAKPAKKNPAVLHIEEELTSLLGTRVTLGSDGRKGMIEIHYYSKDELDGLIDMLRKVGG